MANPINHYAIVILAAGNSSRLGSPKQLLSWQGSTLLRHSAEAALDAGCGPVMVVTGAKNEEVNEAVKGLAVEIVENVEWEEGMASSLRVGLRQMLEKHPETDGIIFMVCDQPFVTKSVLLCLTQIQEKVGKAITAAGYGDKAGTPALFHRSFFERLMELKGDKGARMLIANYPEEVTIVPFAEGAIDIDTKEDYARLINL
jgi:molybdenum cofactor cytidylyltransferase